MLKFESDARSLRVLLDGKPIITHSTAAPLFATSDASPEIKLVGDSWSISGRSLPEKPLTRFSADEAHSSLRFGSPRRWISLGVDEREGAVALKPDGSSRKFARIALMLPAPPDSAVYGGGLSGDLRGRKITLWESERSSAAPSALREAIGRSDDLSCAPIAFFYDDEGSFVAFRHAGGIVADFTHRARRRFELWGIPDEIIIGRAESREDAMRGAAYIGANHRTPPRWALEGVSVGVEGGEEELLRRVDSIGRAGIRPTAVYIRDWSGASKNGEPFRDYAPSSALYPHLGEMTARLRTRGIRAIARVTPQLDPSSTAYHEAARLGLLLRDGRGAPQLFDINGMCAQLDLTNPDARAWAADILEKKVLTLGFAAISAEGASVVPPSAVCMSGDATTLHNRWARLWLDVCGEAARRAGAAVFATDAPAFATMGEVCGSPTAWQLGEGVASAASAVLGQAAVGVGVVYADARAGLLASPPELRSQQLVRFAELSAFLPHFRFPTAGMDALDPSDLQLVANMAKLHARLAPYMAVLVQRYLDGGLPPIRPSSAARSTQFFVGGDLTVAPVGSTESNTADVTLPDGAWVRLLDGSDYTGGRHRVEALPGFPAAFYRRDSEHATFFRSIIRDMKM